MSTLGSLHGPVACELDVGSFGHVRHHSVGTWECKLGALGTSCWAHVSASMESSINLGGMVSDFEEKVTVESGEI